MFLPSQDTASMRQHPTRPTYITKYLFRISVEGPAIVTEAFRDFSQAVSQLVTRWMFQYLAEQAKLRVLWLVYLVSEAGYSVITHSWCSTAESPSPNLELESVASQEGIVRADCITAGRHNLEVHQGYKVCSCRTDSCRLHSFDNSTDIVPSRPWWTFNLNMATDGPFRSNLKPERLAGKQLSSNCC